MKFSDYIKNKKIIVGMIHLKALPGTPNSELPPDKIIEEAVKEAKVYKKHGIQVVLIENMHDVPYIKNPGPEVVSLMAIIGKEIKNLGLYCGIQILASANKEALAAANSAGLDFIRAEGFVFAHIADEGYVESCAGELLRYRKAIGADNVLVFADIKKKHSSHSITADTSIEETACAADFFMADGLVVTGKSTGIKPPLERVKLVRKATKNILIIGSGMNYKNIRDYINCADMFIIGSSFKKSGVWKAELDEKRVAEFIKAFNSLVNAGKTTGTAAQRAMV